MDYFFFIVMECNAFITNDSLLYNIKFGVSNKHIYLVIQYFFYYICYGLHGLLLNLYHNIELETINVY